MNMFSKVFGTRSQREVKRIMPLVEKIESLRPDMQKLSDEELRGKQENLRNVLKRERHWMICFLRHLRLYVKPASVFLGWNISVCSSSVVSFSIRDVSQR